MRDTALQYHFHYLLIGPLSHVQYVFPNSCFWRMYNIISTTNFKQLYIHSVIHIMLQASSFVVNAIATFSTIMASFY